MNFLKPPKSLRLQAQAFPITSYYFAYDLFMEVIFVYLLNYVSIFYFHFFVVFKIIKVIYAYCKEIQNRSILRKKYIFLLLLSPKYISSVQKPSVNGLVCILPDFFLCIYKHIFSFLFHKWKHTIHIVLRFTFFYLTFTCGGTYLILFLN